MRFKSLVLIVILAISCNLFDKDDHFIRNPNLELLITHREQGRSAFFPILSKDGRWIYFILGWRQFTNYIAGDLYKHEIETQKEILVINGEPLYGIGYIDLSPDGNYIVATNGPAFPAHPFFSWGGELLLLIDTSGIIIDTLDTLEPLVADPRFNWDGTKIYFYGFGGENPGIYRINPDGTGEEYVAPPPSPGYWGSYPSYEILENDSVITFSPMTFPRLNRQRPEWVVVTKYFGSGLVAPASPLILINTEEGDTIILDDKPYPGSLARYFPYWTPGGGSIIFSVAPHYGVPSGYGIFDIWVLKNVFEQTGGGKK